MKSFITTALLVLASTSAISCNALDIATSVQAASESRVSVASKVLTTWKDLDAQFDTKYCSTKKCNLYRAAIEKHTADLAQAREHLDWANNEVKRIQEGTVCAEEAVEKERTAREEEAARERASMAAARNAAEWEASRAEARAEQERIPKLPGARIGMTMKQVLERTNWGRPDRVNRTTTKHSVSEQWVYEGSGYLYFENGKLTAIQN